MFRRTYAFFAIMLLIVFATAAQAEIRPGRFTVSPHVGGFLFEGNRDLEHSPVYGLRLGYDLTKNCGAEAVFGYIDAKFETTNADTNVYNYRVEGLYHFFPDSRLVPFLAVGLGGMRVNYQDNTHNTSHGIVGYGAGFKYFLTDCLALRADVRHLVAFNRHPAGNARHAYNNLEYALGLTFYFGGSQSAAPRP